MQIKLIIRIKRNICINSIECIKRNIQLILIIHIKLYMRIKSNLRMELNKRKCDKI